MGLAVVSFFNDGNLPENYNMAPKEKAEELVNKMKIYCWYNAFPTDHNGVSGKKTIHQDSKAKQCALYCVDEIMKNGRHFISKKAAKAYGHEKDQSTEYWQEVKTAIEKL